KNLLILEDVNKTSRSAGVILFNPTNWTKVKTTTFSKSAVLDVAPLPDGSMFVSTLPLDGNGGGGGGLPPPPPRGGGLPPPPPGGNLPPPPSGGNLPPAPGGAGGHQTNFRLFLVDAAGTEKGEIDLGVPRYVTNAGYIEFDPTGKKLFASSWR